MVADTNAYKEKLKNYNDCYSKLSNISKILKDLKGELVVCEKGFKDGGYLINGETLDRGELKIAYEKSQDIIDEIDVLSTNVKADIEWLKYAIANSIDENR